MTKKTSQNRRSFIRKTVGTALAASFIPALSRAASTPNAVELTLPHREQKKFAANDQINVAVIGAGIMGFNNAETTSHIAGVKLVAFCDLYDGHLQRARELYGNDIYTTKSYMDILNRKDVDAVIIATSDHWHDRISIDALGKGKHVYCEKPMVHHIEEGAAVIEAQKKAGKVYQVGSQRVSAISTAKAQELYASGIIGELVMVDTWMDRSSANGAWQYSIPTDAAKGTVDWKNFLGDAPKIDYDPVRFFRWRNYQDYGTGMAGDLFVHLFSELHAITSSLGPNRIYATGGLRFWKDGRDVPDVMLSLFDYPETEHHPAFNLQMRVNFVDGSDDGSQLRLIGTEGCMTLGGGRVKVARNKISKTPSYGGWDTFNTFADAQQKEFEKWYRTTYPPAPFEMAAPEIEYVTPRGYNADNNHHQNFYDAIRGTFTTKEDAWFGLRAAAPALAANKSYFDKKPVHWDPVNGKLVNPA